MFLQKKEQEERKHGRIFCGRLCKKPNYSSDSLKNPRRVKIQISGQIRGLLIVLQKEPPAASSPWMASLVLTTGQSSAFRPWRQGGGTHPQPLGLVFWTTGQITRGQAAASSSGQISGQISACRGGAKRRRRAQGPR